MNYGNKFTTPTPKKMRREKTTLSDRNSDSGKDAVHVYCRFRPLKNDTEPTECIKLISADTLALTTPVESKGTRKEVHHKFKHIFTSYSTQKEVFDHVAYPLLEDLLNGKNGLLFTYGITGSGKTYTLTGEPNDPGIMPRCIDTLFNSISDLQTQKFIIKSDKMNGFEIQTEDDAVHDRLQAVRSATRTPKSQRRVNGDRVSYQNDGTKIHSINENNLYAVFVSYIEIYNNSVYDLLDESSGRAQNKILREDCQKNMYVNGVTEIEVKSAQEAFDIFNTGQRHKKMGATALNSGSSRSHSIFNIRVVQLEQAVNKDGKPIIPDKNIIKISQLSLVDLAGSERTNRTQNTGTRLKEASSINNSLMSLRTCLEILRENQLTKSNKLVPYRDSKLTLLFKNYFEGEGSVLMIVCVNPSIGDFEENLQVMKFAEMTQDVKILKKEIRYTPIRKNTAKTATPAKPKTGITLLPDIPMIKFNLEDIDTCGTAIDKIIRVLKHRRDKSNNLEREVDNKERDFRNRLIQINQENVLTKNELKSLEAVIKKEKLKTQNLYNKYSKLESNNESLKAKNEELQQVVCSLHNVLSEKDLKLNQNILEKEKAKQKQALAQEKMSHELDAKLRRQREHLNAEMKAKENKIKKAREILDCEMPPIDITSIPHDTEVLSQVTTQTPKSVLTDIQYRRNVAVSTSTPRPRRSRSAGERWLEHNAIKPVPLGTVLQPSMKKRKSVTKLSKARDVTNPKQSKYCLIAQEQDTDGETETKLYKADIVPTCGGGAQVIFNDVERLRQESPTRCIK